MMAPPQPPREALGGGHRPEISNLQAVGWIPDGGVARGRSKQLLGVPRHGKRAKSSRWPSYGPAGPPSATGCILLNLSAPDGDGTSLVREIRRRGVGLPVVATIDGPDAANEAEVRRAGALVVLTKPWDVSPLLAILEGTKGSGLRLLP